jgi:hypothetical protein
VAKEKLPAFQAQTNLILFPGCFKFKFGGLYDPWPGIIAASGKSGCKWII